MIMIITTIIAVMIIIAITTMATPYIVAAYINIDKLFIMNLKK